MFANLVSSDDLNDRAAEKGRFLLTKSREP